MAYRDVSAQLKILKTTGGTNSNPANPWYWHAAYFERAAAGESDVSSASKAGTYCNETTAHIGKKTVNSTKKKFKNQDLNTLCATFPSK